MRAIMQRTAQVNKPVRRTPVAAADPRIRYQQTNHLPNVLVEEQSVFNVRRVHR